MCGLWRILPDFCQEPLVGRFFSENPGVFQLLLKRIGFYFFKFSFLAWFDFLLWGGFFFGHSWENFTFWRRTDQQGGKESILSVISPSLLEQGQQIQLMSLHLVSGKAPSSRVWQGMWSLTLDKPFLSLSHVLKQPRGSPLQALSLCHFTVPGAGH